MPDLNGIQRKFSLCLILIGCVGLAYGGWQWWELQRSMREGTPEAIVQGQSRVPRMILMVSGITVLYGGVRFVLVRARGKDRVI